MDFLPTLRCHRLIDAGGKPLWKSFTRNTRDSRSGTSLYAELSHVKEVYFKFKQEESSPSTKLSLKMGSGLTMNDSSRIIPSRECREETYSHWQPQSLEEDYERIRSMYFQYSQSTTPSYMTVPRQNWNDLQNFWRQSQSSYNSGLADTTTSNLTFTWPVRLNAAPPTGI